METKWNDWGQVIRQPPVKEEWWASDGGSDSCRFIVFRLIIEIFYNSAGQTPICPVILSFISFLLCPCSALIHLSLFYQPTPLSTPNGTTPLTPLGVYVHMWMCEYVWGGCIMTKENLLDSTRPSRSLSLSPVSLSLFSSFSFLYLFLHFAGTFPRPLLLLLPLLLFLCSEVLIRLFLQLRGSVRHAAPV